MEHRWGQRLSTSIPVRIRCPQSPDRGCRCLGCLQNVSTSGALVRTELGIQPAARIVIETLTPALGLASRELPACVVRADRGQLAVEWMDLASTGIAAVLTERKLASGWSEIGCGVPALGRVPYCARASAAVP